MLDKDLWQKNMEKWSNLDFSRTFTPMTREFLILRKKL